MPRMPQSAAMAIVRRELLTSLRKRWSFVCLLLFAISAILGVLAVWPHDNTLLRDASSASTGILFALTAVLMGGCALFIPSLAASTLTSEKEQDTFEMLTLTLVRPSGIVAAKLMNALGFYMILVVAVAPVVATTSFLVGVDWAQLFGVLYVVLLTATTCSMIGLLCSGLFRHAFAALTVSYIGMMAFIMGPMVAFRTLGFFWRSGMLGSVLSGGFYIGSPVTELQAVLMGQMTAFRLAMGTLYHAAIILACFALVLRSLRRTPKMKAVSTEKPIDDTAVLKARRNTFPYYLLDPMKRKKPIEDERNPMMVRELRWGLLGQESRMVRAFYLTFILMFFAGIGLVAGSMNQSYGVWVLFQLVIVALAAPALLGNAVTKEYELGNIDMLRMTLMRPEDVVNGKLLAGLLSIAPVVGACILSTLPVGLTAWFWGDRMTAVWAGYPTLLVVAWLSLTISMFMSTLCRRTVLAMILTYLASFAVFIGATVMYGPVLMGYNILLSLLGFPRMSFGGVERFVVFLSPFTGYYAICGGFGRRRFSSRGMGGSGDFNVLIWLLSLAAFVYFGYLLLRVCVWGFRRFSSRER
ncbi:MAG: ABC transporter permease subunit [bacterium]|nr:ABC transporter permease subunit [bacterium]